MQVVQLRSQPSLASISQLTRKVFLHFRATQQAGYLCSEVKVAILSPFHGGGRLRPKEAPPGDQGHRATVWPRQQALLPASDPSVHRCHGAWSGGGTHCHTLSHPPQGVPPLLQVTVGTLPCQGVGAGRGDFRGFRAGGLEAGAGSPVPVSLLTAHLPFDGRGALCTPGPRLHSPFAVGAPQSSRAPRALFCWQKVGLMCLRRRDSAQGWNPPLAQPPGSLPLLCWPRHSPPPCPPPPPPPCPELGMGAGMGAAQCPPSGQETCCHINLLSFTLPHPRVSRLAAHYQGLGQTHGVGPRAV